MPQKTLCPKCHGQRTTSCVACRGTGKNSILGITIGNCKACGGTGRLPLRCLWWQGAKLNHRIQISTGKGVRRDIQLKGYGPTPLISRQALTYNRMNQAMITKDLIEIISGAEAL